MNKHPKFQQERARLLLRLEEQKQLIEADIDALKQMAKPLEVAKDVVNKAADSFQDNTLATQGVRLALTAITRRIPHPVVGITAQIVVPMVLNNFPQVLGWIQQGVAKLQRIDVVNPVKNAVGWVRRKWRKEKETD